MAGITIDHKFARRRGPVAIERSQQVRDLHGAEAPWRYDDHDRTQICMGPRRRANLYSFETRIQFSISQFLHHKTKLLYFVELLCDPNTILNSPICTAQNADFVLGRLIGLYNIKKKVGPKYKTGVWERFRCKKRHEGNIVVQNLLLRSSNRSRMPTVAKTKDSGSKMRNCHQNERLRLQNVKLSPKRGLRLQNAKLSLKRRLDVPRSTIGRKSVQSERNL